MSFTENDPHLVCYRLNIKGVPRNVYLRTYAGDIQIFYDIFWSSIYSLPSAVFSEARTIVDIGAHAGITTLFLKLQSPKAIIYAIEADEKNYNILLQNLATEIKNQQVIPMHAALADRNELIYLERSKFSYNTRVSASPTDLAVKGIKMEQFFKQYNITQIDILKIDIEGAETFLFCADAPWLEHVKHILIELHSDANVKQFENAIRHYNFRIEKRASNHENIYWAYKSSP